MNDPLIETLEGSTADLALTLRKLGDSRTANVARDEISDRIFQCSRCRRWRDADLREESGRCFECEDKFSPRERSTE